MRKGIYLLVILLFPSIIYMLFSLGTHNVGRLGFYGDAELSAEGDSIFQPVPSIQLKEALGASFPLSSLEGKIVVLDVIDWPCDETCKKTGVTLANYLVDVEKKEEWVVLTICINSAVDEAVLADFASKHLAEGVNWRFVTAESEAELEQFLNYVFIDTKQLKSLEELPTQDVVLMDSQLRLRAYFDSRIHKENKKLEDAIKLIIQEPFISWKEKKN